MSDRDELLGKLEHNLEIAISAMTEAQATIARQQVMLDRALEASFDDKARADRAEAEIVRLREAVRGDAIMPQHVIRVAAALIDALHVLDTEAVQIADAANRSGGVDGVQILEDAEKIIKAAAGFVASELNGVPPANATTAALSRPHATKGDEG